MEVHQIHQVRAIFHYESLPPPVTDYCCLLYKGLWEGEGRGLYHPSGWAITVNMNTSYSNWFWCVSTFVIDILMLYSTFKISLTKRKEWGDKLLIFLTSTRPKRRLCKLETLQNVAFAKCRLCKLSPCIQLNVISRHIVYITWSQYTLTSSCYYHNTVLALAKKSTFCSDFSRIFLITVVNVLSLLVRIFF